MRARKDICCWKRNRMKRGQEEMVGFVLIMIIVAIVFLIVLGLSIRKNTDSFTKDIEINQYLESMMKYTSGCAIAYEPNYYSLEDLIKECYENPSGSCTSQENICSYTNKTVSEILAKSFSVGDERAIRGYEFDASLVANTSRIAVFKINKGNCSSNLRGGEYSIPIDFGAEIENIVNSLTICY